MEADAERETVAVEPRFQSSLSGWLRMGHLGQRRGLPPRCPIAKDGDGAGVGSEGRGGVDSLPALESPRQDLRRGQRGVIAIDGREERRGHQGDFHPEGRD